MPELPEVQTLAQDLQAAGLPGLIFQSVQLRWPRIIAAPSPEEFVQALPGRHVSVLGRQAKYLLIKFSGGGALIVHLRMTGKLDLCCASKPSDRHDHLIFGLSDGRELRYNDTRKFGRVWLLEQPEQLLGKLGVEPLSAEFSPARFLALMQRARMLKPLLLDQHVVAGLGNIYVDEALWEAQLHPRRLAQSLSDEEAEALRTAIITVLERGLRNMGTSLGTGAGNFYSVAGRAGRNRDELRVFRRTGLPCPRCESFIQRSLLAQRGTHTCPNCQRLPTKELG